MKKKWMAVLPAAALALTASMTACAQQTLIADYVTASSTLGGGNYYPQNVQDFNADTAWVEGVAGNGIGECLFYAIEEGAEITGITVFPGYQKSEDLLFANSAPVHLRVTTDEESDEVWMTPAANTFYGNYGSGYTYYFEEPLFSDGMVEVEILDIRPGTRYEDTCISELRFIGFYKDDDEYDDEYDDYDGRYDDNGYGYEEDDMYAGTTDPGSVTLSSAQSGHLASFASHVCRVHQEYGELVPDDITSWDLTDEEQAFLLYWYQYNVEDHRISTVDGTGYHMAYVPDMEEILHELFGEQTQESAFDVFLADYVEDEQGELLYMNGTGDFGDAGPWYFETPDAAWAEGNMVGISGRVMSWNSNMNSYIHADQYTAYFTMNPKQSEFDTQTWCFNEVQIGSTQQY